MPPLEGLWWVDDGVFLLEIRNNWRWALMIRQPQFVTQGIFEAACLQLSHKKPLLAVQSLRLETFEEGLCVQALHKGPYATEPETMLKIESFIKASGLCDTNISCGRHHEIYISDPRRGTPEGMKTVLRYPVRMV